MWMLVWRESLQRLASRAVEGGVRGSVSGLISDVSDGGSIAVGVNISGGQQRGLLLFLDKEGSLKWFKRFDRPLKYVGIAQSGERIFAQIHDRLAVFDAWGNELFSIDLSPSPEINLRRMAISRSSGRYVAIVKGSWSLADLVLVRDGSEQWRTSAEWFLNVAISPSGEYIALVELKSKFIFFESAKIKLFNVKGKMLWSSEVERGNYFLASLFVTDNGEVIYKTVKMPMMGSSRCLLYYIKGGKVLWSKEFEVFAGCEADASADGSRIVLSLLLPRGPLKSPVLVLNREGDIVWSESYLADKVRISDNYYVLLSSPLEIRLYSPTGSLVEIERPELEVVDTRISSKGAYYVALTKEAIYLFENGEKAAKAYKVRRILEKIEELLRR